MEILLFWNWHAVSFLLLWVFTIVAVSLFSTNMVKGFTAHNIEKDSRSRRLERDNDTLTRAVAYTEESRASLRSSLTDRKFDAPEDNDALIAAAQQVVENEDIVYVIKNDLGRLQRAIEDEQQKRKSRDEAQQSLDSMPGFWRHTAQELRRGFSWLYVFASFMLIAFGFMIALPIEQTLVKGDLVKADLVQQYDVVKSYNSFTDNATVVVDDCPVVIQARYDYDLRQVIISDEGRIANRDYILLEDGSYVTPCIDK